MKVKYYLNNVTIGIMILIGILLLSISVHASNDVYAVFDNELIKPHEYKIILTENISSGVLIDVANESIFVYTLNYAYLINSTNGSIKSKLKIANVLEQAQTDDFLFLKTENTLYKVQKTNGTIVSKTVYNKNIGRLYSGYSFEYLLLQGLKGNDGIDLTDYNFIAGNNINITQSGNDITITGAATWTLSGLTTDNMTASDLNITNYIYNDSPTEEKAIRFDFYHSLMLYYYNKVSGIISSFVLTSGSFYVNVGSLTDTVHELYVSHERVEINANTLMFNGRNIKNDIDSIPQLNSSVQIIKQTAFEAKINVTQLLPDRTYIPYDFILKNITVQLNNNTGYLNFSVKRYISYPSSNETLFIINNSNYETTNSGNNTLLNRGNTIELTYNNYSKINNAIIVFELEHYIQ